MNVNIFRCTVGAWPEIPDHNMKSVFNSLVGAWLEIPDYNMTWYQYVILVVD